MQFRATDNNIGKKTNGSNLNLPPESADKLENFETVRDGIYRKPRGRNIVAAFTSTFTNIKNYLEYNDYLIASIGTSTGQELHYYDHNTGLTHKFTGTFTEPKSDFLIRNIGINSNSYFTTSDGIKVLDKITGTIIPCGMQKAIGFDLFLDATTPTWLNGGNTTSYRVVWSRTDNNTNLIVGPPSERVDISNPSIVNNFLSVKLDVFIPAAVLDLYNTYSISCKLSVYRATQLTSTPAEDFQLCYEVTPAAADFAEEVYTFIDICPDSLRGAALYTNTFQEGIAQSNYQPPLACCIDQYKNYMLLGNTRSIQRLNTNLISTINLSSTSEVKILDSGNNNIGGGVSGCVTSTGLIKVSTTNAHGLSTGDYVYIYGVTGTTEANGTWKVTYVAANSFTLQGSTFANAYINGGTVTNGVDVKFMRFDTNVGGSGINQNDGITNMITAGGLIKVTTLNAHGLSTDDYIRIYNVRAGSTTEANGCWKVTYVDAKNFTLQGSTFANAFVPGSLATSGTWTTPDLSGAPLAAIILVKDGKIKITVDGADHQLQSLDFTTSGGTWAGIANTLQSQLTDASVVATTNGFKITSLSTGVTSTVIMAAGTAVGGTDLSGTSYFKVATGTAVTGTAAVEGGHIDLIQNRGAGITGIANNGSGKCRFATSKIHGLLKGDYIRLYNLTGTPLANGIREVILANDTTHFDVDIAFVGTGTGSADLYEDLDFTPAGTGIRAFRHTTGTDAQNITNTALSFIKAINLGYPNGIVQAYYMSGVSDAPGAILFDALSPGQAYFYLQASAALTGNSFIPALPLTGTTVQSFDDDTPHSMSVSKTQEFEAFPLSNTFPIGNKGDPILGVMAMKDCVYIVKQKDGIWKLVGDTIQDFVITKFYDCECLQINSICKGQNSMFLMTNQGRLRLSDTGVEQISGDNLYEDMSVIENTNFTSGYGWFYDTENSYMLATHRNVGDTDNTYVSVYNGKQQNWWDWITGDATDDGYVRCGVIVRNKCYTASVDGLDIYEERKDFALTDFATSDIINAITAIDVQNNIISLLNDVVVPLETYVRQPNEEKYVIATISSNQLQLNNTKNLVIGACTLKLGIVSKVRYQQCTCQLPEYEKSFNSISALFDDRQTDIKNIILRTHTDESKTEQDTLYAPLVANFWGQKWGGVWGSKKVTDRWLTEPPKEHSRGNYIYIQYTHRIPEEQCAISGYSINYDATTAKYEAK